ncbi:hypothetical protein [Rhizobium oryzicola]|uniref:Uncharacterized protein n=1 Tax=Rhizobium oryzicola TaxID=1232668 RepID=A0ABT8SQD2_9HYPH|nr:hypothetical protein [Rhizobium oryzicola]MDO1580690.1 hypothetical protein [Rhizobium oryzicola]
MSDKREAADWLATLSVMIIADLTLFTVFEAYVERLVICRLLSLLASFAIAQGVRLASGLGKPPSAVLEKPGLWPLIVITTILNTGLFVLLSERAPLVQPLVLLGLAWLGSLAFLGFGLHRIRRFGSADKP